MDTTVTQAIQVTQVIQVMADVAVAIAMGFSAVALFLSARAFTLQRQSLQANLFKDISNRINELTDQWSDCKTKEAKKHWYEKLFATFEYFAFFANHGYLSGEMKYYYKSGIEEYCDRLQNKHPELLQYYKTLPKEAMGEFKRYYEDITGKTAPF